MINDYGLINQVENAYFSKKVTRINFCLFPSHRFSLEFEVALIYSILFSYANLLCDIHFWQLADAECSCSQLRHSGTFLVKDVMTHFHNKVSSKAKKTH